MTNSKKLLITKWFGTFLCDLNGTIVDYRLFPKQPDIIAHKLNEITNSKILSEEKELAHTVGKPLVIEKRLLPIGDLIKEYIFISINHTEYGYTTQLLHDATIIFEYRKLEALAHTLDDRVLIQAVNALADINEITNILAERLESWRKVRNNFVFKLHKSEADAMTAFSNLLNECNSTKNKLENFIKVSVKTLLPNVSALVGDMLAAKIIASAGSIEKLAKLPASTIQVLGAEKAFFSFLKKGTKCPKHGVIFLHPLIHTKPYKIRGKIARAFAGKLAIAAKADYYKSNFIADKLIADLKKRINQIETTYEGRMKKR